jgi:hypothetical protein
MRRIMMAWLVAMSSSSTSSAGWDLAFTEFGPLPELPTAATSVADEPGDQTQLHWNIKGVEAGTTISDEFSGFRAPSRANLSATLQTQIATGAWARRIAAEKVQFSKCSGPPPKPSELPPFDANWLREALWPLTRSHVVEQCDELHDGAWFCTITR